MNDAEKTLVWALRSGLFKQGRGHLLTTNGDKIGHCCLMVANIVLDPDGFRVNESNRESSGQICFNVRDNATEEFTDFLTYKAQSKLGWSHQAGVLSLPALEAVTLARCNDDLALTFDEIADLIEGGLVKHVED